MAEKKGYSPTYRDELAISRHFVQVLEQQLGGRDSARRTNVHPLDWCHLGVIGPAKQQHAPVELDATTLEAEVAPEGAPETKTGIDPAIGDRKLTSTPEKGGVTPKPGVTAEPEDPKGTEKPDERDGTRRPPSAIGFEALIQPEPDGVITLTLSAQFCVFTKHLPDFAEQTSVLDAFQVELLSVE